ncbi:diacylglycerol kinase [Litoreibacter janthinus]|uniref:Diacylglycerol kinase n=1 Tax=Litoreibacter janthinus TaxID=670154 RepID=A0A1I6G6G7_9RHOB|nr:diacylglycerol kinase [Litoreibacter janthinus]SFR37786.1 diacylglycerol kinase [Litoreibacter janthinus]
MSAPRSTSKPKPKRVTGQAHLLAAANYSNQGLRRLWEETAFRHEVFAMLALLGLFIALGASLIEFALLIGVFLLLAAVEALNTAIECIVDHLTTDWATFARDAKDLGSLAVMCVLLAGGTLVAIVVARHGFGL